MLSFHHDPLLVSTSIFVAIVGCLLGLATLWRSNSSAKPDNKSLFYGALFIGGTIWSMHFIAMTAVKTPITLTFDIAVTAVSFLVACLATAVGLYIAGHAVFGSLSIPAGGVIMGLGIASMHYLGMEGIRNCKAAYTSNGIYLSLALGVSASAVALAVIFSKRGVFETLLGALVLGGAICAFHYTAMNSTVFYPDRDPAFALMGVLNQDVLGYVIAGIVFTVSLGVFGRMVEE